MVSESELVPTEHGLVPKGQGCFVLNARETHWWERNHRGVLCEFERAGFEGAADFVQLGINLMRLSPGEPMAVYHRENAQEASSSLPARPSSSSRVRNAPLRQWDFVHCPPETSHVIIGAGAAPCLVLAVGARDPLKDPGWAYPVAEAAIRHGAGVERETTDVEEAYARFPPSELTRYREGWLPERVL